MTFLKKIENNDDNDQFKYTCTTAAQHSNTYERKFTNDMSLIAQLLLLDSGEMTWRSIESVALLFCCLSDFSP